MMPAFAQKRPARPPSIQDGHIPAPTGGLNTISAGSAMPQGQCPVLVNAVCSEMGLRSRLGWREWCTGLGGLPVRTELPFTGATKNGSANRLFGCTQDGIYDVSTSCQAWAGGATYIAGNIVNNGGNVYTCTVGGVSASTPGPSGVGTGITDGGCTWNFSKPFQVVTFPVSSPDSGYGVCSVMVTSGGHFLFYTDEENGLYLYTSTTDTWQKVVSATQTAWVQTTAYIAGTYVLKDGNVYVCAIGGTSGTTGPTGTGPGIVDGSATWNFNFSVSGVDPASFVGVCVWKGRAWFVQKDTANSYYLGLSSLAGAATLFAWGNQFRAGGCLVGLWNWTVNGAQGIDNFLVGISQGGDIVIYAGTDPSSINTFGIKGVWFVPGVPAGRHIATNFGGDMLVAAPVGLIPLSKLISGNIEADVSQYSTAAVANLFNLQVQQYGANLGWNVVLHPLDNTLLVLIPVATNQATNQLAMSLANRSWSQYSGLPIFSAEAWNNNLYFGTADGRICVNDGYVDGVTLANPGASTPIQCKATTRFDNLGTAKKKQVQIIRPLFESSSTTPSFTATARYDFDLTTGGDVALAPNMDPNSWDSGLWDVALWGGDYVAASGVAGACGVGSNVAIEVDWAATSRTILIGIDVAFQVGGIL